MGFFHMWEFCRKCMLDFEAITEEKFLEKYCSHCLDGARELVLATNKEHGTCDTCTEIVIEHLRSDFHLQNPQNKSPR